MAPSIPVRAASASDPNQGASGEVPQVQKAAGSRFDEVTEQLPAHGTYAADDTPTIARSAVNVFKPSVEVGQFDHYTVERRADGTPWELGRGGMGVTYKAIDTNLECPVALKVINPECLGAEQNRERFIREARSAAQIRHPNVASVYHLGRTEDQYFYAMEYIDGLTAHDWVERRGPMSPAVALNVVAQVASALAAADRQHIVHRDIKPSNLMILEDPDHEDRFLVKLIDFGLVRSAIMGAHQTLATCGFIGTPQFASPEQAEECELDIRSDIYSLGCTLWFLLTGRPPFSGSVASIFAQHLHDPPKWERVEQFPAPVRRLLAQMLCKDPAGRPQNANELRTEIETCLAAIKRPPLVAPRLTSRWRLFVGASAASRRTRGLQMAGFVACIALCVAAAVLVRPDARQSTASSPVAASPMSASATAGYPDSEPLDAFKQESDPGTEAIPQNLDRQEDEVAASPPPATVAPEPQVSEVTAIPSPDGPSVAALDEAPPPTELPPSTHEELSKLETTLAPSEDAIPLAPPDSTGPVVVPPWNSSPEDEPALNQRPSSKPKQTARRSSSSREQPSSRQRSTRRSVNPVDRVHRSVRKFLYRHF